MRDDYIKAARAVVPESYILVNMVSLRVKQLRQGSRRLIESLETLALEDVALREIAEGKISFELAQDTVAVPELSLPSSRIPRSTFKPAAEVRVTKSRGKAEV